MKTVPIVLIFIFIHLPAFGKSLYVSPSGSDATSYASNDISNPWATPSKAFTSALPSDTVYFRGGSYTITSSIETRFNVNPADESERVTFTNYPGEIPSIVSTVDGALNEQNGTIMIDRDYYTVSGLTIEGPSTLIYVSNTLSAINFIAERNTLTLTIYGGSPNLGCVRTQSARANGAIVRNNTLAGPGDQAFVNTAGVYVFRTQGIKVENNVIHNIPRGIFYKHTCVGSDTGIELKNNYIYDVYDGIVTVSQYTNILNNIIVAHNIGIFIGEEGGLGDDGENNGGDYNTIKNNTVVLRDIISTESVPMNIRHDDGVGPIGNIATDNIFMGSWNEIFRYSSLDPQITMDYNVVHTETAVYNNSTAYTLAQWIAFYGGDANSISGMCTFIGDIPITISGFELSTESVGYNAGSLGADIGADVSTVGIQTTYDTPIVTILTESQATTAASVFNITGTATADTGQTISGVTCFGQTVTPDDGTWDEQIEAFTCLASLTLGENTLVFIGSDGTRTGSDSLTVTRIKKTSKINGNATIKNATIHQ